MKTFVSVLGVVLLIGCVSAALLSWVHTMHIRSLRKLQPELVRMQTLQVGVNQLILESIEYSKRNPAILPVLQNAGIQLQAQQPTQVATPRGR